MKILCLCAMILTGIALVGLARANEVIETGSGRFYHQDISSGEKRDISVYYHLPDTYTPDRPILFVMHGNSRTAVRYWRQWQDVAEAYNVLILVPEFDKFDFPGSVSYHSGGMYDVVSGEDKPRDQWTFSIIDRIFEQAKRLTNATPETFFIYGHSAGGQFVHRYLTFTGGAKVQRAIAANSGWYTLPVLEDEFPYGLKDSPATTAHLADLFAKNLIILLGEDDTRQTRNLRQNFEAMEQGAHRLARGKYYYATAERVATGLKLPFNWRVQTVPGVGHSNGDMAPTAAKILFGN
jgi:poly(3-hydroxybutyrate) depolymerase